MRAIKIILNNLKNKYTNWLQGDLKIYDKKAPVFVHVYYERHWSSEVYNKLLDNIRTISGLIAFFASMIAIYSFIFS